MGMSLVTSFNLNAKRLCREGAALPDQVTEQCLVRRVENLNEQFVSKEA